jgi:hypothetical protein
MAKKSARGLLRPNVHRAHPPPTFLKGTKDFSPARVKYINDVQVCFDLVAITGSILGKPLTLRVGNEGQGIISARTYGNIIEVPSMHPNRRVATKHELAHHYGKSDTVLRHAFCEVLVGRVEYESGKTIPAVLRERLVQDLSFLNNIFDDIRVNSLWGLLYPGDGRSMDEWYYGHVGPQMKKRAQDRFGDDIPHLVTFLILAVLGQDVGSTRWGKYGGAAKDARDRCKLTTFAGSLVVMRNLLLGILRDMVDALKEQSSPDTPEPSEGDALVQIATSSPTGSFSKSFASDDGGFDRPEHIKPSEVAAKKLEATAALNADDDFLADQEIQALVDAEDIRTVISRRLSAAARNAYTSSDDWLTKTVKANVVIHRPERGQLRSVTLSPQDELVVKKWRGMFQRVLSSTAMSLEEDGDELNVEAYLQHKLTGEDAPYYEHVVASRGYKLNLLVDMSGSMRKTFPEVERLAAVLQRSLKFPFSRVRVWGFQSTAKGTVNMVRYPEGALGLTGAGAHVGGVTPLSQAIQIAGREMMTDEGENHVFVLSDGMPVYQMKDRAWMASTKMLMGWVRDAVSELKHRNVRTHCFMMGPWVPENDDMDFMFGHRQWKKIPDDRMFDESFDFIMRQFMQYLRRR